MAKKRSYSSATPPPAELIGGDVSTEGVTFELDGVTFTCHGWASGYDLSEVIASTGGVIDTDNPGEMGVLSDFLRQILGEDTYRAFTRHRRKHRTPDATVTAIMGDILIDAAEAATGRPTPRSSTSSPGPALTAVSSPATSSPEPEPATTQTGTGTEEVPEGLDIYGEITTAPAGPPAPEQPPARRIINLGDRTRTRSEPLTG